MTDLVTLDPDQERDAQRIASEPTLAALESSTMSAGKTLVALRVAQIRDANVVLVIAPLQTRLGWKVEAEKLGLDYPFYWIRNHKEGREAMDLLQFSERGIYFIGPEYANEMAWDWVKSNGEYVKNEKGKRIKKRNNFWDSIYADLLIVDEVHKGTINTQSQRYKFYASLNTGFKLALSGTPTGNNFEGAFGVTSFLWPDIVGRRSADKKAWKERWCETEYDHWSYDHMKVIGEKTPGAYFNWLPCVVRREWKYDGHVDSKDIYVELSAAQRKAYRELEQNLVTWIEGQPFTVEFPPSLRIRLRQATLGMFSVDDEGSIHFDVDCKSVKLDTLKEVLADDFEGEPALILTDSKKFAKATVARLEKQGHVTAEWSADFSAVKRDEIKQDFIDGKIKYVVMIIKAGGTGTNRLQEATRNIVYLSADDSRIENEQAEARIIRRGQGDLVRVRRILAIDTYDVGIVSKQLEQALAMRKSLKLDSSRVAD